VDNKLKNRTNLAAKAVAEVARALPHFQFRARPKEMQVLGACHLRAWLACNAQPSRPS
jgi:hypothetical protein